MLRAKAEELAIHPFEENPSEFAWILFERASRQFHRGEWDECSKRLDDALRRGPNRTARTATDSSLRFGPHRL